MRDEREISEEDLGNIIFLTVPDDQIKPVVSELAAAEVKWDGRSVIHCSGNLTSGEFAVLKERGAMAASMHPIQTFTQGDGADRFQGITVSLEGDQELLSKLSEWVHKMGAKPVFLNIEQKRMLHLSAVFACNYLTSLLRQSDKLLEDSGIEMDLYLLKPLILQTLDNIFEKGVQKSLTGPISRGDVQSVRKHIEMIKDDSSLSLLYRSLGLEALKITEERGGLSVEELAQLKEILAVKK